MENLLYYTKPASCWDEAIPLGNGTMGAMIYGGYDDEIIRLNHSELWSGEAYEKTAETKTNEIEKIRQLISQKKYHEATLLADTLCEDNSARYLPMGDIILSRFCESNPRKYSRSLDLKTGTAEVYIQEIYLTDSVRKSFISHPHKVMVIDIINNSPYPDKKLSYSIDTQSALEAVKQIDENEISVSGRAIAPTIKKTKNPLHFNYTLHVEASGGKKYIFNKKIVVELADRITIYYENGEYILEILPAKPKEWQKGSVSGICAKGGFTADISWDNDQADVKITSRLGNKYKIISPLKIKEI